MLTSYSKDGDLFLSLKQIDTIPWVWGSHLSKYGPACYIVCLFVPPIFCFVLFDCLFGRGIGSVVVLLYTPCTLFSKGISSFISLNVYMPWDPLFISLPCFGGSSASRPILSSCTQTALMLLSDLVLYS